METTTEPSRRWWQRSVPVRLRITVAVVVLTALALAGAGVAVFVLQQQRLDRSVDESISREFTRFSDLTAEPAFKNVTLETLLTAAVQRAVPNPTETVVGFVNGRPRFNLGSDSHEELRNDPEFARIVNDLTAQGGGVVDESTGAGPQRIAVRVIEGPNDVRGAMVFSYSLDEVHQELDDIMRTYLIVAAISLGVVAVGAYVVSGRLLRPIRDLRETAEDISESDLTRRITATGNDDLTDLTVTFNRMLDRLDSAFSTQRQFLDDVGHELKTPITIVRGHLELMDSADVAEVTATRELVLDEMDRMGRLVEELILLAKTRRPDFVHVEPSDLGALTDILLDKMRGLADRDWQVDARAAAWVEADQQRLTQAVLQLAANAVRHTQERDVVAIGSAVVGETALLWVRDAGEGIDLEQQARVFERFRRGTSEGEGSGLGLAIVRGIAQAHGGEVRLESEPGAGATFTISFPAHADSLRSTR